MTRAFLQDTTVIEANQFPIKSVKLFGSGTAEITRKFPLSFLRSQDEPQVVEIVHLPVNPLSIDVSVTSTSGNVTILDHYHAAAGQFVHVPGSPDSLVPMFGATPAPDDDRYRASAARRPFENSTPSSQTLRELEAERLRLEDERRLRQQSFTFLTTYMDSLAQCKSHSQPEAAQMVSFFDDFVEIGITRSAVIAELDVKLADVGNRIRKEKERLSKLSRDLPVKVVTVLSCNSQVPVEAVELTVTYVVIQVSWKPAYDLHIAMTGNTPSATVRLDVRCKVTQWTGENWENVSLALTTEDQVSQLIQLPEPKRIDISLDPTHVIQPPTAPRPHPIMIKPVFRPEYRRAYRRVENEEMECDPEQAWEIRRAPAVLPPPHELSPARSVPRRRAAPRLPARSSYHDPSPPPTPVVDEDPEVDVSSQTVSQLISRGSKNPISHIANGYIFIPSDHAEHHVLVTSLSLRAEFMRVVVPSTDTRVYYTCEVKNTSEHVLLPGTVKAYLNDKHVSSTDIHNTEMPQVLECSLAVDTGVKTIHNRTPDALPSLGAFTGKATTTYTSATIIHNTHAELIRGVIVRSAIPLPADPRITIVLKEPAGLAEMDEGSVSVREGCLARWSTTGGRKGKQAGLFEWVCDVNPGTEALKAVWEVCTPQELNPFEQVRS